MEPDMYFVDTKNVIRILDVEIIGPHNKNSKLV